MEKNFSEIYKNLVDGLYNYCKTSGIKSMVLGISGGIDSTLTAAIAHSVSARLNIPLIGVSLPSGTNESTENSAAIMVGNTFCSKFEVENLDRLYGESLMFVGTLGYHEVTKIACGNIKARLRMLTLYHIASLTSGIVLDTDNRTEHMTGFFTIHGDDGDIGVLRDLDKSTIFAFADWMIDNEKLFTDAQRAAIRMSRSLNPTDGNGVGCDLEQFGLTTYEEVDKVVNYYDNRTDVKPENVGNVEHLIKKTWYKRLPRPLYIGVDGRTHDSTGETLEHGN